MAKKKELVERKKPSGDVAKKPMEPLTLKFSEGGDLEFLEMDLEFCSRATGFKTEPGMMCAIGHLIPLRKGEFDCSVTNFTLKVMEELAPADGHEGILISQMLAVNDRAKSLFRLAEKHKDYAAIYFDIQNQAIKLMRLYLKQLEALDRHRRGGNQRVTVEHVHVNDGGQAIVGSVGGDGR